MFLKSLKNSSWKNVTASFKHFDDCHYFRTKAQALLWLIAVLFENSDFIESSLGTSLPTQCNRLTSNISLPSATRSFPGKLKSTLLGKDYSWGKTVRSLHSKKAYIQKERTVEADNKQVNIWGSEACALKIKTLITETGVAGRSMNQLRKFSRNDSERWDMYEDRKYSEHSRPQREGRMQL